MPTHAIKVSKEEMTQLWSILDFYLENVEQQSAGKDTYLFAAQLKEILESRK